MDSQKKIALIFDLEGVLIDHIPRQAEVITKAFESIGMKVTISPQDYQLRSEEGLHMTQDFIAGIFAMQKMGISFEQAKMNPPLVAQARKKLTQEEQSKIAIAIKNSFRLRTKGELTVNGKKFVITKKEPRLENIRRMLAWADAKGIPLVMVTAAKKVDADQFMQEAELEKYFPKAARFYRGDKSTKGPAFARVAKQLESRGIARGRQWVVEDSITGIRAAKENGLRTALVLSGNTSLERVRRAVLAEKPTLILRHAEDLLGTLIHTQKGDAQRQQTREARQRGIMAANRKKAQTLPRASNKRAAVKRT